MLCKVMEKRGQVTTFIIVGIVALIVVILLFSLKDSLLIKIGGEKAAQDYLKGQMKGIEDEIGDCVAKESNDVLVLIGKQGGYIESVDSVSYNGVNVAVLCNDIMNNNNCLNNGLFNSDVENELNIYLKDRLKECINLRKFKEGFKLHDYELKYDINTVDVETRVNKEDVLFKIMLPVEITKDEFKFEKDEFAKKVNIPLGGILDVVNDILNSEASSGDFDIVGYNMKHINEYDITMTWRGANKIYIIKDDDYLFQFVVGGENEI